MTSFLSKQKSSKFLFLAVLCFAASAGAAYDAGWTRTDCSNYSYRGLNERYVYGSNKGWIDNNAWDSTSVEGVDCASYVCRTLALPEYVAENQSASYPYATSQLYQGVSHTVRIYNIEDLQPWDLWVWRAEYGGPSPGHTGLFKQFSGSSIITREALSESVGVVERTRSKQDMIDWGCRFYRRENWAAGSTPIVTVTVPSAQTNTANTIQQASATLSGAVLSDGGATIDSRGFAWGTTSDCESGWVNGTTATTFSTVLTGLSPNSRYYFQAQAHNSQGWGSGQVQSFVTAAATAPSGGSEIIIDNGSSGTSSTGTWGVSGGTGSYGTNSLWARDGATYTWRFTPPSTGTYDVYMWWTQYDSRGTAVPVAISHDAGKASLTVNQRINGGQWNLLGQYNFSSTGAVTLTAAGSYPISNCADAVKFVKTASATPSVPSLPPSSPTELTADFSVTAISGEAPLTVQFTDLSGPADTIYAWRWDFDYDGRYDSSAKNPTYTFTQPGTYDVRLVVFNADGSDDLVVRECITVGSGGEPSAPGDIIMDNGSSGTSSSGTWGVSGGTNAFGSNSLWARETAAYRWTFTPPQTGRYEVSLWWTDYYSRGTAVPVQISHSSGTANTTVNQQTGGGRWNTLGTYPMTGGQSFYVQMNTAGDGSTICADAIRVRWISD
jgi:PKD repeat protein